jgi:tRNA (cmo5U34)-methyltransferase
MDQRFDPGQPGGFTFQSIETAEAFDAHVREQLPWYDLATGVVVHFARHFIPADGTIIEVGASTGNIGRALQPVVAQRRARYLAIDNSAEMVKRYAGPGEPIESAAEDFDFGRQQPDLIIAFLVLMFVRPAVRFGLVERMRAALRPGGAIIVFDKREPSGGEVGQIMYRLTLAAKYENGAPPEEIIRKELSLAGVQRPLASNELRGFVEIFRFGDFSGWLYAADKMAN